MFVEKSPLLFNLSSVPPVIRQCWELHHAGQNLDLLQRVSREIVTIRALGALIIFCVVEIAAVHSPGLIALVENRWLWFVALGALFSVGFWFLAGLFLPMHSYRLFKQFVREHGRDQ